MRHHAGYFAVSLIAGLLIVSCSGSVRAGESVGLSKNMLDEIEGYFELDAGTRALVNAITNNDVLKLAYNRERSLEHNDIFNHKIETKGITDQKSSGRCWIFAGFNIMKPAVLERFNIREFEFSENHLFFWDKLEKANMFLEAIIETRDRDIYERELEVLLRNPVPDGGWWTYVVTLIGKYGTVPKSVMPETQNSERTRMMNAVLNRLARRDAVELRALAENGKKNSELRRRKRDMLRSYYRILALHLGLPPKEFVWRYEDKDGAIVEKTYTPGSFYEEAVGVDLGEYVSIFDHPAQEYQRYYKINFCRNMQGMPDMHFVNLEVGRLKEFALASMLDGEPVWFSADIGKENDRDNGILAVGIYDYESLYGIDAELTKEQLITYRASTPNHAMAFIGVDTLDTGAVRKWLVENSWGTDAGNKGLWSMYDDWFDRYVYAVIVHKRYLTDDVLALLETKPRVLPAWDPMRAAMY